MRRFLLLLIPLLIVLYFIQPAVQLFAPRVVEIKPGQAFKSIILSWHQQGIVRDPYPLILLARLSGKAAKIQAGIYQLSPNLRPLGLLNQLTEGKVLQCAVTLKPGQTLNDFLKTLKQAPYLEFDAKFQQNLEGTLFPETYHYPAGSNASAIIQRAQEKLQFELKQQWSNKTPNLAYKKPYQALIVASIIEKESGYLPERPLIASVINNRLKKYMPLQVDPTVLYAHGKYDFKTPSPYNTYINYGLPPTPIAMPSRSAIMAACQPAVTEYLYFVAKTDGSGSHFFSRNLEQHNRLRKL